jgi:hypothetical protein
VDNVRGANALLTGAAGGLGRHIARALAAPDLGEGGSHPVGRDLFDLPVAFDSWVLAARA